MITNVDTAERAETITIVLVHDAFADGGSWSPIIPNLQDDGFRVIAIQNPLTTFGEDIATTRRVVDTQPGPVVLVGHGYGGAVITAAASGAANVRALVYVAAFAPDEGEQLQALLIAYPSKLATALVADTAGFLSIDRAKFGEVFAGDVSERRGRAMAAVQRPIHADVLTHACGAPAWRQTPSWYLVATEDQAITPALQHMFAARMDATSQEIRTSHAPFASNPGAVHGIILDAAASIDRTLASRLLASRLRIEPISARSWGKPTIH